MRTATNSHIWLNVPVGGTHIGGCVCTVSFMIYLGWIPNTYIPATHEDRAIRITCDDVTHSCNIQIGI